MNYAKVCSLLVITLILAGCDSEPSQVEIERAFQQEINNSNEQVRENAGNIANESMMTKLNSVKKISCEKNSKGDYNCKIDADIKFPFVGQRKSIADFEFIKTEDGWKFVK